MGGERAQQPEVEQERPQVEHSVDVEPSKTKFVGGTPPPVTAGFDAPKASASDLAFGLVQRPPHEQHGDSIERLHKALTLAEHDAQAITQTMLAGYKHARDARDAESVAELGGRMLGLVIRMQGAKAAFEQMRPSVAHKSMQGSTLEQDLKNAELLTYVDANAPFLEQKTVQASVLAMVTMIPHEFRGEEVAGVAPAPDMDGPPELIRARMAGELDRTLNMLLDADAITKLVLSGGDKVDRAAHEAARQKLYRWSSRPIDLAFLRAALGPVWNVLDATASNWKPSQELEARTKQAEHTGWLGDTGEFTIGDADMWLRLGGQDNAEIVLRHLYTADPDTRAMLLAQMNERGLLRKFCSSFGWAPIKELHDSIVFGAKNTYGEVKSILQSYFIGGKDKWGPSIDSEWDSHDNSLHHHIGRIPGVGGALNFVGDLATFGFHSSYGKTRDAHTSGQMSDDDYYEAQAHNVGRLAVMAVASIGVGAIAGGVVRGGAASVSTARAVGAGFAAGSTGSMAGLATSDAYNIYISGQQEGMSSPEDYIKTAIVGGTLGGVMGGVLNGISARSRGHVGEETVAADEAATVAAGGTPYRAIENPKVADAATKSGMQTNGLNDAQLGLMDAAEVAIAKGDLHTAAQIGDDLIRSGIPKEIVQKFEAALAEAAGKTNPGVYRDPVATLPNGKTIEPSAWGGDRYYGTSDVAPETVWDQGFKGRGGNTNLNEHVHDAADTAFRGTTTQPVTPNGEGGAAAWADEGGWVYKIKGTPSWDVNAELQGRVQMPDGTYRGNIMPGEGEQAMLANIPRERIEGAWQVTRSASGKFRLGPFIKNPNYVPQ